MFFDTHAHLADEKFEGEISTVINDALGKKIDLIMCPGADLDSSIKSVKLANEYEMIYCSVGIHPHDASGMNEQSYNKIKELASNIKVKAIGEIGLDYHYDFSPRELQKYWFKRQLLLAKELNLPVIIHDREAHKDVMDILKEINSFETGVLMHCYSGSKEQMIEYVKLGAYISLAGPVTFKNSVKLIDIVKNIDLSRLMIETDSPYLAPVPVRGKRNEPGYISFIAQKIAEILEIDVIEVAKITKENGKRFFSIGE